MKIEPYLFFNGRCEEALAFYREALGANVTMMMRFSESPEQCDTPLPAGWEQKIMHAAMTIGGTVVMASDGMGQEGLQFAGFSLSLSLNDEETAKRLFDQLSKEGQVNMPLGPTFWSPCFGMVVDRFGIGWMIGVEQ